MSDDQIADEFEEPESVDEVIRDLRESEERYDDLYGSDDPYQTSPDADAICIGLYALKRF